MKLHAILKLLLGFALVSSTSLPAQTLYPFAQLEERSELSTDPILFGINLDRLSLEQRLVRDENNFDQFETLLRYNSRGQVRSSGNGVIVGNGGDFVSCDDEVYFSDYYYAAKYARTDHVFNVGLGAVIEKLRAISPAAHHSLKSFAASFERLARIYNERAVDEVSDEWTGIRALMSSSDCSLVQGVKRVEVDGHISYQLNSSYFKKMDSANYSWLVVHEWLWNYLDTSERVYRTNELLHRASIDLADKISLRQIFE